MHSALSVNVKVSEKADSVKKTACNFFLKRKSESSNIAQYIKFEKAQKQKYLTKFNIYSAAIFF